MEITLSIIIVNFNTKKLTLEAVSSIINSKPKVKFEIIVVDNGSSEVPRGNFRLIANKTNLGFAKANNQGIKIAAGKYILLLNSDTKVKVGAIDKLIEFALNNPDAGAVVPKLVNPDGSVQPSCLRLPSVILAVRQYIFGQKGLIDKYVPDSNTVEAAVMAAFLITPECLKKAGALNEKYFMYFEDLDYCRKINNLGLKIYYLKDAEVVHYHGASGKNLSDDKNQWRRLIPSSKIYHGLFKHYLINAIIWLGQKWAPVKKI